MTNEQFEHEINYRMAVFVAKSMLKQGIIDEQDYREIDTILTEKCRPLLFGQCA